MSLYCWDWYRESQTERQFNLYSRTKRQRQWHTVMASWIAELRSKDGGHTYDDFIYSRTESQRQWHIYDDILTTDANGHIFKPFASWLYWVNFLSFASEKVLKCLPFKQVRLLSLWVTTVLTLSRFCLMYKYNSCLAHCLTLSTCQYLHSKSVLPFSKSSFDPCSTED